MESILYFEQEIKEFINQPLLLSGLIYDITDLTELKIKYLVSKTTMQFKIPRYGDLIWNIGVPLPLSLSY